MELDYGPFERRIPLADDVDITGAHGDATSAACSRSCCRSRQRPPRPRAGLDRGHRRGRDRGSTRTSRTPLPILPLKETVVFPDSMTPLAIGQERSIELIDDVVAGDRLLALVTVRDPEVELPGWDDLYEVGHDRADPQDDQGARRDAADPRPGTPARPARRPRRRRPLPRGRLRARPGRELGVARGRGAHPQRPGASSRA